MSAAVHDPGLEALWQHVTRARSRVALAEGVHAWAVGVRLRGDATETPPQFRVGRRTLSVDEGLRLFQRPDGRYLMDLDEGDLRTLLEQVARRQHQRSRDLRLRQPHDTDTEDGSDGEMVQLTGDEDYLGEQHVSPSKVFGVTNCVLVYPSRVDCDASYAWYGDAGDVLVDARALGAHTVRNLGPANLTWDAIFPDPADHPVDTCEYAPDAAARAIIPPPDALYEQMVENGYEALAGFSVTVLLAWVLGIQVTPTLFAWGGGSKWVNSSTSYGAPLHEVRALQPNMHGFDPFYLALDTGLLTEGRDAESYQAVSLTVFAGENGRDWLQEVARRKCLAVAAFGKAIGEYFAWLDDTLGGHLRDVVPVAELGIEFDVCWLKYDDGRDDLPQRVRDGSIQLATYQVMLASAIHEQFPSIEFRVPCLVSREQLWPSEEWTASREYLAGLFTEHLETVTARLRRVSLFLTGASRAVATFTEEERLEVDDWIATCEEANFYWPPESVLQQDLDAAAYVHEVDIHWYHFPDDRNGLALDSYQDQTSIFQEAAVFKAIVLDAAAANGYSVRFVVSEIGFPSAAPPPGVNYAVATNGVFLEATPEYQAAMVIRLFLTFWAIGASTMNWHAFQGQPQSLSVARGDEWNVFTATSLRNDLFESRDFNVSVHRYRLPSWFSFRRLVALTNLATACEKMIADDSLVVIRLTFRGGVPGYSNPGRSYRYAYVAWNDFKSAPLPYAAFELSMDLLAAYESVPMVPVVDPGELDPSPGPTVPGDDTAFPTNETLDWQGALPRVDFDLDRAGGAAMPSLRVTIYSSDPVTNPAPLVLLTNGRWAGKVGFVVAQPPPA